MRRRLSLVAAAVLSALAFSLSSANAGVEVCVTLDANINGTPVGGPEPTCQTVDVPAVPAP